MTRTTATRRTSGSGMAALLLIQLAVGYEWLVSGLTKIVHGDFPSGLAAQLAEMSRQAPSWYRGFLTTAVMPHAPVFGYAIELAEILAGIVLAGAAVVLLVGGGGSASMSRALQLASFAAAFVGIVLAVNFELANGGHFGTTLASDSFDEGVDLDTIMIAVQLALVVFSAAALPKPSPRYAHERAALGARRIGVARLTTLKRWAA